jgi:hypothetical protein
MTHLDPEARRIVSLARAARTPSTADKQRVRRRIALAGAATAGAGAGADVAHAAQATGVVKAVGVLGSVKLYVVGAVIILVGAASYALVPVSSGRDAPSGVALDVAALDVAALDVAALDVAAPPPVAAVASVESAPAPATSSPSAAKKPGATGRELTKRSRAALPLRAAGQRTELARDLDLLHGAQAAWREGDSGRTLSLLDQHAREYPKSSLREERGGLRVLALCELGRKAEARRLADALIRRAPHSPVLATIEQSCAFQ